MESGHVTSNINVSATPTEDSKDSKPVEGHKKASSGSKLTFPFFGSSQGRQDATTPRSPVKAKPAGESLPPSPRSAGSAMAAILQQKKTRKRKGSLRKTALLGRKVHIEDRVDLGFNTERTLKPTNPQRPPSHLSTQEILTQEHTHKLLPPSIAPPQLPDSEHHTLALPFPTIPAITPNPPLISPSTTDDEELLTSVKPPAHEQSYFPPFPRRRPAPSPKSPLSSLPISLPLPSPLPPHDYAETRAWGWVLLAATWIVFVVGMGSCLGVWSWAWDVGETPYAPPELEDDPTLPIVGYYPALIILTGVMAWVWVVVAWVGMKYFRHAKMGGEEEI